MPCVTKVALLCNILLRGLLVSPTWQHNFFNKKKVTENDTLSGISDNSHSFFFLL